MIHSYRYCKRKIGEIGEVIEVKDFLVKVQGLPGAVIGEAVAFETGEYGRIMEVEKDVVEILVFSRSPLRPRTKVARTKSLLSVCAGSGLLGHVINTLGHTLSKGREKSRLPKERLIETRPIGIWGRKRISRFFATGVTVVDLLLPLGFGQRELVIGDRKTGKTDFVLRTILSQANSRTICIYCAIGKRKAEIKAIEEFLKSHRVLKKCIIVAADSYSSPAEIFLAPYTAMSLAEYFRDQGRDVLVALDDLTTHAKYYREISLLLGAFPGRESYPGDVFHIHSKILERAGCFLLDGKEVTITCLPVAESVAGDFTGYIQTNLMSMTDGHIYLDGELFTQGRRPAVNVFLSVTRVGRQTQTPLARDISIKVTTILKKHEDAQRFLRFGSELTEEIKNTLRLGDGLFRLFNQTGYELIPLSFQTVLVSLLWLGLWDGSHPEKIPGLLGDSSFRAFVDKLVREAQTLEELNRRVEQAKNKFLKT